MMEERANAGNVPLMRPTVEPRPRHPVELSERCVGYGVYDPLHQKIGKAEKAFANGRGSLEYVRVKMGLFGLSSVLIPVQDVEVDDERRMLVLQ